MKKKLFTYKKSGVDIAAADKFVNFISKIQSKKKGNKKFRNIGGFGSISDIPNLGLKEYTTVVVISDIQVIQIRVEVYFSSFIYAILYH